MTTQTAAIQSRINRLSPRQGEILDEHLREMEAEELEVTTLTIAEYLGERERETREDEPALADDFAAIVAAFRA